MWSLMLETEYVFTHHGGGFKSVKTKMSCCVHIFLRLVKSQFATGRHFSLQRRDSRINSQVPNLPFHQRVAMVKTLTGNSIWRIGVVSNLVSEVSYNILIAYASNTTHIHGLK